MLSCTIRDAFFIGLILTTAAAMAQEDDNRSEPPRTPYYGFIGPIWLLTKPGVQKELGLDLSESQKLLESLREIDPTHTSFETSEEKQQHCAAARATMDETRRRSEEAIQKSLSEEQFRRFQQLELQQLGGRALLTPETAKQLALTAEQEEKLKKILRESLLQESLPADPKEKSEKIKSDLLAVLTPEQTNQWKAMTGTPFKSPKSFSFAPWELVFVPEVHKELGLSEEEAATLVQSLAPIRREVIRERGKAFRSNRADLSPADRNLTFQQTIDTVKSSLTVSQWNRLQELILQNTGVESFNHPEVAKKLGLSWEQREQARKTINEYRRVRYDVTLRAKAEDVRTRQQKEQADLLEILTPDQRKQWEAMQGAKVDLHLLTRPEISAAEK